MPRHPIRRQHGAGEMDGLIKSAQEIEYMRQAARAAEAATLAGIEAVGLGATENDVAAEMHHAQIKAGSEYTGLPMFIASGVRSTMTHATWYRRPLQKDEVVFFEGPGCVNRYHAAMMREVYIGDPPEWGWSRGMDVVTDTLAKAKEKIKPGVVAGELFEEIKGDVGLGQS